MKNLITLRQMISARLSPNRQTILKMVRMSSNQSFRYDDLQINMALDYQKMSKPDPHNLAFGSVFSDHMFEVEWTRYAGWSVPRIVPLHYLQMHPGSKVLHYAQAVFEGMKAFRQPDGSVSLFRPDLNIDRLIKTAERAALPKFDGNELLKCLRKLVLIDKDWVPNIDYSSLYIRPTFIGNENTLGVSSSNRSLLYIVTCPVGSYFKSHVTKPVSLLADPKYVRAWPGGAGSSKMASNYAPTLYVQKVGQDQGFDQVLWLFGKDHQIAEVGGMNVFVLLKDGNEYELVTPPLDGTILPGVVRQSILDITRHWGEFKVSERVINMKEFISASKEKRLVEMFICGTASTLCPVGKVRFQQEDILIPSMESNLQMHARLLKALIDIQYGKVKSEWSVPVEDI